MDNLFKNPTTENPRVSHSNVEDPHVENVSQGAPGGAVQTVSTVNPASVMTGVLQVLKMLEKQNV